MIYLDNAATSWPKPEEVYRAMDEFARNAAANPGRSGHRMALESERRVQEARALVARLLHAEDPSRIVLTLNGTDGLNIAIKGCLRRGDHVVTTVTEHNSINRPLGAMERAGFATVTRVRPSGDGMIPPEEIEKALTPQTRLVAVTHCSNVLGVVNPVEAYAKITRPRGVLLLVDAAQSAGVVEIDVQRMGLDLVAFPGHKNLFGPMGTGALYVRRGVQLAAWREGGTGVYADKELQPDEMPFHLEGGTPNAHGLAGLAAGLKFIETTGVVRVGDHERRLAIRFIEALQGHPKIHVHSGKNPDRQVGPVSLLVDGVPPEKMGTILDEKYGIACRPGLHCAPRTHRFLGTFPSGSVRFSFGWFNTVEETDAAARALHEIAGAH